MALDPEIFIDEERGSNIWPSSDLGPKLFINSKGLLIGRGLVKKDSSVIATLYIYHPKNIFTTNDNNVGFTFSVGDTTPRFTISIEQDN